MNGRPIRVLHIIDSLGGGGSERHVWDIVRLSDPTRTVHRVVTVYPDDGSFVYAERLLDTGAYRQAAPDRDKGAESEPVETDKSSLASPAWKRVLRRLWYASLSRGGRLRRRTYSQALISESSTGPVSLSSPGLPTQTGDAEFAGDDSPSPSLFEIVLPDALRNLTTEYLRFRPDVIHGHTFHGFGLGLFFKLMFRKPMVFFVPALFSQLEDAGVGYLPEQYKRFHPGVDRFFTSYPAELLGIGVPAEKIVPMNVVVDLDEIARVKAGHDSFRAEVRGAAGITEDALVALSVGRLHPSKGHQYALEALPALVKLFPNFHWMLIGKEWGEERAKLEERAKELGVEQHIHIIGFVEEPLPFYAASDIYLRTSVFEGDNLSSCQAMAMALPVVGFETKAQTELVPKVGHGFLVPVRDAESLAEAIARVLSLPDRGQAMGKKGEEYCRAHLDIQHLISILEGVYSELRQSRQRENLPGPTG